MRNFAAMHDLPAPSAPNAAAPARLVARAWTAGVAVLLTLPWLNPFAPGPSPSAAPLLFSWICAALVLLTLTLRGPGARGADAVRALVLGWLLAALFNALIGLLQYAGASAHLGVWLNQTGPGEAFGNLRQRNQYATLMAIGLASSLWWARQSATRASQVALIALAAVLGAGNAASSSRTGLLQWGLLAGMTLYWLRGADRALVRRVTWVALSALLAYALAMLVLPWLIGRDPMAANALARLRAGDTVCASRLTLWRNVLHLISLKPWTGWGWGELDYAHFITLYSGPRFCDILDNAHNLPLQLAVELGLPLTLLLCAAAVWMAWRARPWREPCPSRQLAWAVLAVIGLHSLLEYPLWYGPFQIAALASLGLLTRPAWLMKAIGSGPRGRFQARHAVQLLALLLMLCCAIAAWNYRIASQIYLPPEQRVAAYRDDTLARSQGIWLYADQLRFAELTTADLTPENAARVRALALQMLHFSPEARVVRLLLDSDRMLGRSDELAFYAARFKAAFPADYARWQSTP